MRFCNKNPSSCTLLNFCSLEIKLSLVVISKESDQRAEDYKLAAGTEEREVAALAAQNRALQTELDTARHQLEAAVIYPRNSGCKSQ